MRLKYILIALCLFHVSANAEPLSRLELNGAWKIQQDEKPELIAATVPGCVQNDLRVARKIPDPYYRNNIADIQWVSDSSWTYSRKFEVSESLLARGHVILQCEGLDTVASIRVNGKTIGSTDNMYRTYEFDVKPALQKGENTIEVAFSPVGEYIKEFKKNAKGPMSMGSGGMSAIRKSPYMNGWDFGPKMMTVGIYKSIGIEAYDEVRIASVAVNSVVSDSSAKLEIKIAGAERSPAAITVSLRGKVIVKSTATGGAADIAIADPELWWPVGMGSQPLYDVAVDLLDSHGQVVDHRRTRVGIRTIKLLPKTAELPLRLSVNGKTIFCKGADWIPCDLMTAKVTPEKLHQFVADMASANMNMVRTWGGGYYEEDAFYDACDELGVMVWSEFKFACSTYPSGNPVFVENVRSEIRDQVARLRNHPSIAVWCGNNEVESLITGYKILKQKDYDYLFHEVMGTLVKQLMPDANYVGGSPEAGDEHNWWVWHVGANYEKYLESHGWMTEFGFQSFPCPATVNSYTLPEDRTDALSPIMKAHQHNGNKRGNEMIVEMMSRYFHPAKDFDSMLWLSQINQAYGMSMGVEHWRADWPKSSGALVWQLDDDAPGPSWALIDYYGRWKAAQYSLARSMAPLAITATVDNKSSDVRTVVCGDLMKGTDATVHWSFTDVAGNALGEGGSGVVVPAGTSAIAGPVIDANQYLTSKGKKSTLLWIELIANGKVVSRKTIFFAKPKDIALEDPKLATTVIAAGDGFDVTITGEKPALWAWVDLTSDPDARYSDRFIDIRPEAPMHIHISPSKNLSLDEIRKNIIVRSLYDTY